MNKRIMAIDFGNVGAVVIRENETIITFFEWKKNEKEYDFDFYNRIGKTLVEFAKEFKVTDAIFYRSYVRSPKEAENLFKMIGWCLSMLSNCESKFTLHEGVYDNHVRKELGLKIDKKKCKQYSIKPKLAFHTEYNIKYTLQTQDFSEEIRDAEILSNYLWKKL